MAKVVRDGPELIVGVAFTRLIDVQGSEQFEARWLKALRQYLKWSNSQLELEKTFKDKDIQRINYCQRYLNVTRIADVTLARGKQLDPHMYKGERSLFSSM
eukprot:2879385-Ditylum_brightwellii.AAC.1